MRKIVYFFLFVIVLFFVLNVIFSLKVNVQYSKLIYDKDTTLLHTFLNNDEKWRMKISLNEVPQQLQEAILFKEDKYFYYHFGVNPIAIFRAFFQNTFSKKRISGASTITMQVARLLEPKKRTYTNKIIEIFRAFQLEFQYSKKEILELYFNLIPYGGNIEGVKAASYLYFGKSPQVLSLSEITCLCIIPNNPTHLRLGKNNLRIQKKRNNWLNTFLEDEIFEEKTIKDALSEKITAHRRNAPKEIPHLAYRLKKKHPNKNIIFTEIDLSIQKKVESITLSYIEKQKSKNIGNACILVINNKSMKVKSYVGSADFYSTINHGQVDGIRAIRSPGSTLKPLLFALAFDKGIITSKQILEDLPINFGNYSPKNFDYKYYGRVSAEFALSQSLNIPPVKLLDKIGVENFIYSLKKARFKQIEKDEKQLGLSLILGGCGVNLEEITQLYACFANRGRFKNLIFTEFENKNKPSKKIVSEEASFLTTEILSKASRPDFPIDWENSAHIPKIAWKTGTSAGRRDAWCIAYNKKYTVGVWVGNFSGKSSDELTGAKAAAPLAFLIFDAIDYNSANNWFSIPENLKKRKVCSKSGLIPNSFCKNTISDYYISGISSNKKCNLKKYVYTSKDTSVSYCPECLPKDNYIKVAFLNYSFDMLNYLKKKSINYKKTPTHNYLCNSILKGKSPEIISPIPNNEYLISKNNRAEILLKCKVSESVENVNWYVNNHFLKNAKANEKVFFRPPYGKIKISCSDDKGRNSDIYIRVRFVDWR